MSIEDKEWSRVVADSLREVEVDVSDQLWNKIELELEVAHIVSRGKVMRWLLATAAVVAIGATSWMAYHSSSIERSMPMLDQYADDMVKVGGAPQESTIKEVADIYDSEPSPLINNQAIETKHITTIQESQEEDSVADTLNVKNETSEGAVASEDKSVIENNSSKRVYRKFTPPTKSKSQQSTMIALNVMGAAASISSSSLNNIAQPVLQVCDVKSYNNSTESRFLDLYQNSDISHRQPFGVALSAGYFLSNRFILVGSVNYTSLVSDLTNSYNETEMVQRLQFIGLPLRVDYSILNNHRFLLYGGIGGGIEYLLSAKVGDAKIDDKRWHYSLSGAIGAEYKFTDRFGLYAEPEIAYYLNKTKLETIRTKSPLTFTMRVGVRFAFN